METFKILSVAIVTFGCGFVEAFFPALVRRIRGVDRNEDENALVNSDRYILLFRIGGFGLMAFSIFMVCSFLSRII